MGNCGFKGLGSYRSYFKEEEQHTIKVVTSNGGIMELYPPITAASITNEFPGHALYSTPNHLFSPPLLHDQRLLPSNLYFLLPIPITTTAAACPTTPSSAPYRMPFDDNQRKPPEVFPRYSSTGVWKVQLVISPEQLSEILSQEGHTEALIESVRAAAKCGNGVPSPAPFG